MFSNQKKQLKKNQHQKTKPIQKITNKIEKQKVSKKLDPKPQDFQSGPILDLKNQFQLDKHYFLYDRYDEKTKTYQFYDYKQHARYKSHQHNKHGVSYSKGACGLIFTQRYPLKSMKYLVQHEWPELQQLIIYGINNYKMDDNDWKLFVQNINRFPNLQILKLGANLITDVKVQDFIGLKKLKYVNFGSNEKSLKLLSAQSKINLQRLQFERGINVQYKRKVIVDLKE